jgi:hypothetical protein
VTTASATSIGSSETSRFGQVRVRFGAEERLHARPALDRLLPERERGSRTRQENGFYAGGFMGATGLEPATSGVTDRYKLNRHGRL